MPLIPEDTAVVASLPNVGQSLAQSYAVFKQRIAENGVLNDWWRESPGAGNGRVVVDQMVDWAVISQTMWQEPQIRGFGSDTP